jgi:hypothetical protein
VQLHGVALALIIRIREILGSNFVSEMGCLD